MVLSDEQKETLRVLRKHPNDLIIYDGRLTGGHGIKINLKILDELKDNGFVSSDGRLTLLGKVFQFDAPDVIINDDGFVGFDFGMAISHLKEGRMVSRKGWSDSSHVFLEEHFTALVKMGDRGTLGREYESVFCISTNKGTTQPGWTPTQPDMLANDWFIVSI